MLHLELGLLVIKSSSYIDSSRSFQDAQSKCYKK